MRKLSNPGQTAARAVSGLILLLPLLALAQAAPTAESFEPGEADLTGFMLRSIFGDWGSGAKVPLVGSAMEVLNLFALTFGTLMFSYVAVIGTLNTAQDGELLGKKWSSMWVPLRFVFGTAMLVPLASGYSTVQHLILYLALVGGGGASQVWSAAAKDFTAPDAAVSMTQVSEDYRNQVKTMMRDILKSEACVQFLANTYSGGFGRVGPTALPQPQAGTASTFVTVPGYQFQWGASPGSESGKRVDECGKLRTPSYQVSGESGGQFGRAYGATGSAERSAMPDVGRSTALLDSYVAMSRAQAEAIEVAVPFLTDVARRLAAAAQQQPVGQQTTVTDLSINAAINAATDAYMQRTRPVQTRIGQASEEDLKRFLQASEASGWMMASSSFFQMGRIKSAANESIAALPKVTGRIEQGGTSAIYGVAEGPIYQDLGATESRIADAFSDSSNGGGFFKDFGKNIAMMTGKVFGVDPKDPRHALVQIKDTGDRLLGTVEGASVLMVGAIASGLTAANIGGPLNVIGSVFKELLYLSYPVLYSALIALFGVAITMSFMLPMLPFMLSVGSILGWLMAVFSAMVAAPVWLAGHLHPEGEGFAGKGISGYMILLETVTRPIFMVLGLIGAFVIMDPMLKFVAWAFRANMSSIQGDSITGILSIVVFAGIYVAIVFTVVRKSLSLIHALSEKVYTWIGGANAGYDQAASFGEAANSSASALSKSVQTTSAVGYGAMKGKAERKAGEIAAEKKQYSSDVASKMSSGNKKT